MICACLSSENLDSSAESLGRVYDAGQVQISAFDPTAGTWSAWKNEETPVTVTSRLWSKKDVDLTAYAGKKVRLGFWHQAFSSRVAAGWYLDEVQIIRKLLQFDGTFEASWGDWYAENGVWEVGTPTSGPGACYTGNSCVATILGGNYPAYTSSRLVFPEIQLPTGSGGELHLRFMEWHSYASEGTPSGTVWDAGQVRISAFDPTAGTWSAWKNEGTPVTGTSTGWALKDIDLTAYAGKKVRLGFFHADGSYPPMASSHVAAGWYLDDIEIPGVTGSNFVVTGVTLIPASPPVNGTFSAQVTVKNQGMGFANGGQLSVWANQPATQPCNATPDKPPVQVGTLAGGSSKILTVNDLPAGPVGCKTLRAFVDSACVTPETNEYNNQFTQTYCLPSLDFVVTGISLRPAPSAPNGTFSATVTVKNQGTAASDGGERLAVWANQPTTQPCNATPNKSVTVGALAAGATTTLTVNGLSAGTVGAKTLRAFVDSTCAFAESNEGNNQLTKSYTVGLLPDFVVTGITLNPAIPAPNSTFRATVTVKNQGTLAGDGGYMDVWANQSVSQTCGAMGDGWAPTGNFTVGQSKTFIVDGLPAGAAGSKTLRAFIDSWCQTSEAVEVNNQLTKAYTVQ